MVGHQIKRCFSLSDACTRGLASGQELPLQPLDAFQPSGIAAFGVYLISQEAKDDLLPTDLKTCHVFPSKWSVVSLSGAMRATGF